MTRETINSSSKSVPTDARIAEIATRQAGLVTRQQLLALGETHNDVAYRLRMGRLHRVHRGVYTVGHRRLGPDGERLAVLLACGGTSFLGKRTALALHGALQDDRWEFDVIVPGRGGTNGPPRALVSRMTHVHRDDVITIRGLRVASLARALIDATPDLSDQALGKAIKEAEYLRIIDVAAVTDAVQRTPQRPGVGRLQRLLQIDHQLPTTEEFVLRFLAVCDAFSVRRPAVDVRVDIGLSSLGQLDLVYERERLIIELDGAKAHMTRHRYEEDRRRDAYLAARGWLTLRFTWRRVTADAEGVANDLRQVLALRSGVGTVFVE